MSLLYSFPALEKDQSFCKLAKKFESEAPVSAALSALVGTDFS